MRRLLMLLPLTACAQTESTGDWLEGLEVSWDLFNHRVSYLHVDVADGAVEGAFIGGTSTTLVETELDEGCDEETCQEFPFVDTSFFRVRKGSVTSTDWVFGSGEASVVATADGASGSISVPVELTNQTTAVAMLQGFTLDTDYELSGGDACYHPENGWHPTILAVSIDDVSLGDDSVEVSFTATFGAGDSFETERECVDAVNDQAQVPMRVGVLVAAGKGEAQQDDFSYAMAYEYSGDEMDPGEQPDPDLAERAWTAPFGENTLVGWSAFEFRFHEQEGLGRGAYLRTLWLEADPVDGYVTGHANNYSPVTQLSAFDYDFTGTTVAIDAGAPVTSVDLEDELDAELDDDGNAVIFSL